MPAVLNNNKMSDDDYDMQDDQKKTGNRGNDGNGSPIQYDLDQVIDNGIFRQDRHGIHYYGNADSNESTPSR